MTRRAKDTRKATVYVERNGACIRVDDVPLADAPDALTEILDAFRVIAKKYPEVIPDLEPVGGGAAIDVTEDDWAESKTPKKRRLGFRP